MKAFVEKRSLLFPLLKSCLLGCTITIGRLCRNKSPSFVILHRKAEVADLIGKEVDVPGPVFHDHTPGTFFRCVRPTWEHCFNPLLYSVWATDKDIHGQDEKLAEVILRIFIRQSFIPDYSCCHRPAWFNRPKISSFKSYFQTRHVHLQGIHHGPRFCPCFCCSDSYAWQPTQHVWLALVWKLLYSRKQQKVSFYVWEQTKSSQSFLLTFSIDNTPLFILQAFQEDHELKTVFCCCGSGSTFTPLRCEAGFKWLSWEQLPMQMAVMTVSPK